MHPDDRIRVDPVWQAALHGTPYDLEHRIVVEGTVCWVRERAKLECDTNGTLRCVVDTMQDITVHMPRFFDPQT